MRKESKQLNFERAALIKRQIFALKHIQDIALIVENKLETQNLKLKTFRIEGYDISNISGTSAVGSMVIFENNRPNKNEYRKFRIRTVRGANDIAMLREILERRLRRRDWP